MVSLLIEETEIFSDQMFATTSTPYKENIKNEVGAILPLPASDGNKQSALSVPKTNVSSRQVALTEKKNHDGLHKKSENNQGHLEKRRLSIRNQRGLTFHTGQGVTKPPAYCQTSVTVLSLWLSINTFLCKYIASYDHGKTVKWLDK